MHLTSILFPIDRFPRFDRSRFYRVLQVDGVRTRVAVSAVAAVCAIACFAPETNGGAPPEGIPGGCSPTSQRRSVYRDPTQLSRHPVISAAITLGNFEFAGRLHPPAIRQFRDGHQETAVIIVNVAVENRIVMNWTITCH